MWSVDEYKKHNSSGGTEYAEMYAGERERGRERSDEQSESERERERRRKGNVESDDSDGDKVLQVGM